MKNYLEYLPQIIITIVTLLLWAFTKFVFKKAIMKYGSKRNSRIADPRTLQLIRIVNIIANFTAVFCLMVIWGVDPKNVLMALSAMFAVVGVAMFAQWSILSNITAGIIIYFTTPFKLGDKIQIQDKDNPTIGYIENIMTFYIHIRSDDGELIIIPNSQFMQKTISQPKNTGREDNL